eukprot:bmy_06171T0
MMLFGKISRQFCGLKKLPRSRDSRYFWGWLNAVFNKVDHERIRDVGPDRAASEWLLRCGAVVRYHGQERWQKDYNHLPTGPLDKYKIQAIDATDSCIMSIGFDHMGNSPIICYGKCRNLKYLFLSDLPGVKEKEKIVQAFKTSLPSLELKLDLK